MFNERPVLCLAPFTQLGVNSAAGNQVFSVVSLTLSVSFSLSLALSVSFSLALSLSLALPYHDGSKSSIYLVHTLDGVSPTHRHALAVVFFF